jgi:hypothetical protein
MQGALKVAQQQRVAALEGWLVSGTDKKRGNRPMKTYKTRLFACAAVLGLGLVATNGSALADALSTPSMSASLSANPNPFSIDTTDWLGDAGGKIYIGGAVSGLAYWQSSPVEDSDTGNVAAYGDLANAQLFIQKTDGWLQFFVDVGAYSFPAVGYAYVNSSNTVHNTFGYVPVAFVKLVGSGALANFSVEGGKLPTLIGDEYGFTFQNLNVERGLLWNNEPIVSRGVQVNYADGPLTISFSLNDGTYTDTYNVLSGLISYGFNGGADTVAFAASGNLSSSFNFGALNAGSVYNLIYTHTSGPWTISPYIQINSTPGPGGSTAYAGAILASYALDDNFKLAARAEYESESSGTDLFGYGSGSNAWSVTLTPTYQWKVFFARADLSYVGLGSASTGFGEPATATSQVRGMLEAGIVF